MISFFLGVIILILGYIFYGKFVEKVFHPDDRQTPAIADRDDVDYVPLSPWRSFLIQLLNIAGLGPIFGAITGALWGPVVYIWIVFGTIFAGGVHDYLSGMLSERNNGASISEIVGKYLGPVMLAIMRVFSVVLLEMVGVVFMVGPAQLLSLLTFSEDTKSASYTSGVAIWTIIVLVYYFLATLLPIDKIISKLYPVFGVCLIIMALGVAGGTIANSGTRPMLELWDHFENMYPGTSKLPIWPLMCISVACGAISGFHSTQSPVIARCIKSEKEGHRIFYGAMVAEGLIALIWASAAIAFYYNKDGGAGLQPLLDIKGGNSTSVYAICKSLLGGVGMVLAMLGVIACPITSGDTAFRSARLTIADWFKIDQKAIKPRLAISVPLLACGYLISKLPYNVIWRYFSWSNQTLAMMVLWAGAVYLTRYVGKNYGWIAAIPATYMAAVTCAYILQASEGFKMAAGISDVIGIVFAVVLFVVYVVKDYSKANSVLVDTPLKVK